MKDKYTYAVQVRTEDGNGYINERNGCVFINHTCGKRFTYDRAYQARDSYIATVKGYGTVYGINVIRKAPRSASEFRAYLINCNK